MKKIHLIFYFYKSFALASIIISGFLCYLINLWERNGLIISILIFFKIITLGIIYYFINDSHKDEFIFYKNLGLSEKHLWISTISFDFMIYFIMIILT